MTTANPPASSGPTALALAGLRTWLGDALGHGVPVEVAVPDGDQGRVCVWPVALLADQGTRGGAGRQPMRLRARYVVTADGPVERAIDLLDRILVAAAGEDRYQIVWEPVPGSLFGTVGALPRPALLVDVPVQIAVPAAPIKRVTNELRLVGGTVYAIQGRVLGPGDVALPGMTVSAPTTGTSVVTDARGGFVLPGQPAGRTTVLHLSGRGLHMRVDVAPETTEPVVIHCDIEEV